ncbi:hypothetical protein PY365_33390 [Roseiarcaceae bacterium H3SJ34-1]|uniref:PepSY domain-containing protein n=1 Tax=Terripilifer ovatus TaxID=3032367 RepID=UPI003AB988B0|nr:hypothetical protein [Roseiarcaceae bacterium H3SJ34-1]
MQFISAVAILGQIAVLPVVQIAEAEATRTCLSPSETRETIAQRKLVDPLVSMRNATRGGAEPLRTRLCRWGDKFVYEMALLRRDGKVVRVFVDAADGSPVNPPR